MEPTVVVTDDEAWRLGVKAILWEFQSLTPDQLTGLKDGIEKLIALKAAMQAVVEKVNCAAICATCGGECCVRGKYHFSAIDLVVYLLTGKELIEPSFATGRCSYLAEDGCLMPPQYRPFNCVTFVCEQIEMHLPASDKEFFYAAEGKLRLIYRELQEVFTDRRMRGSVMSYVQTS